jgi:sulfite exporter TauE/SafE
LFEGLSAGLTLGLATGTACLASCGPVYAAYLLGEKRTGLQSLRVILLLNAGRFIAYALFGAVVGYLGGSIPVSVRVPVAYSGYLLFSVYLLLSVVRVRRTCSGCATGRVLTMTRSPFLLGILTGFSICPAFLIALTGAFGSSGPLSGMMLFIGFFVGTTVYMLPFALFGLLTGKGWITAGARVIGVLVAVYFAAVGARGLTSWITTPPESIAIPAEQAAADAAGSEVSIFAVSDAETLYILDFVDDSSDHGSELAADLSPDGLPPIFLVETDSSRWEQDMAGIPDLSPVLVSWWVDARSGVEQTLWQQGVAARLLSGRHRTFAVQYEPYCADRVTSIESFLGTYSFRCEADSGFTFLMLNTLSCAPADCATCPISE